MKPDLEVIYSILTSWVANGNPRSYSDLSRRYSERTGEWHEPHGSWDTVLGELNLTLSLAGAPALSAFVLLQGVNEPGGGFWGSAPNVPPRPKNELARTDAWMAIVRDVQAHKWPETVQELSASA